MMKIQINNNNNNKQTRKYIVDTTWSVSVLHPTINMYYRTLTVDDTDKTSISASEAVLMRQTSQTVSLILYLRSTKKHFT